MKTLTEEQINAFNQDGYLFLDKAISTENLEALIAEFEQWKEESREHTEPYGVTYDNRPRFDMEPGHSADKPALRRISSPIEISDAYLNVMRNNRALDALVDIIGPNIKFENAKINSKQPGAATEVKFHQDFMFEAHTNDDMVTVLFFIDEVTAENGPLEVVPGTHVGPLYEHWHDGVFTGMVSDEVTAKMKPKAVPCFGPAGSACLMHTRLLHGSAPNLSSQPRTLFICEYLAEDSLPLHANHIPSKYMYEVVRGEKTNRVRCSDYAMKLPEMPTGVSFFDQQAKAK
ncbi:MAG: ectoine hydroxylase-related dioxygenase (phytanoyl-CoA dioxygenase family) [Saprospiraceae bacterium]|jgi:ectoine hydroxylase-related dioxygenase (phytanoyl-CoA dioxygenase family)